MRILVQDVLILTLQVLLSLFQDQFYEFIERIECIPKKVEESAA